jgi:hypothetical protein
MALSQVPFRSPMLEGVRETITREWVRYLQSIVDVLNLAARRLDSVAKTAQGASLSATALDTGTLNPGVYRVSYSARITRAASTSSSLTVTMGWTDGAVAQSQAGGALTGNTTTTQQNTTMFIHLDQSTSITYATTYASSGGTTMQYALYVVAEQVG